MSKYFIKLIKCMTSLHRFNTHVELQLRSFKEMKFQIINLLKHIFCKLVFFGLHLL